MLVKMFIKYSKHRWSLLWTLLLIFQLYDNGVLAAPTKHLKITAKGDTPRLIVTSEEDFGTEPKRLVAAKSINHRTTTTVLPLAISTTTSKSLLAKDQNIRDKSYETDLEKNVQTTADKLLFNKNAEGKDFPRTSTKANKIALGEATTIITTTTTTTTAIQPMIEKNTILKHQYATKAFIHATNTMGSMLQQTETTTISLLEAQPTTLKQIMQSQNTEEQIQAKNKNKITMEAIHDSKSTTTATTTGAKNIIEKMSKKENQIQQQRQTTTVESLVPPVAEHELLAIKANKKYISTTMETPITKATTTSFETTTTNTAVIDKLNDKMMISQSEKTAENVDKHMNLNSAMSTAPVATANAELQMHVTMPTTSAILRQLTTLNSNANSINIISTSTSNSSAVVTSQVPTLSSMDVMLNDQEGHADVEAVKLLDLEKQEPKSFANFKQKHQSTQESDVVTVAGVNFDGHDGIKKTKKKQLKIDKHVLADIGMPVTSAIQAAISLENLKTSEHLFVNKTTTSAQKVKKSGKNMKAKFLPEATYFATHSLGPIHMDEKIYSVKEILPKSTETSTPQEQTMSSFNTDNSNEADNKFLTEQTESKISDIQVEIYDSTVDSILTSANYKHIKSIDVSSTTKAPPIPALQEKFTQYIIDRVETSTQESPSLSAILGNLSKPEPAAIEIHINVSEGIGNGSEDLEFSYPQTNFETNEAASKSYSKESLKVSQTNVAKINDAKNSTNADEILVVEIIDTGDNNTDNAVSGENIHPVFTFRTDQSVNEIEFKDHAKGKTSKSLQTDELFMAEVKAEISVAPPIVRSPAIDHDSDTIFYISNTEVKVGESSANMKSDSFKSKQKAKLNAAYTLSTHPNVAKPDAHRYEEDILLSPLQNTADSLKIFRSQNEENAPPLDVTYVGESVMEVEQLSPEEKEQNDISASQQVPTASTAAPSHVIIQPATLSEIGVPVIGELPPQIELKEFDFMPDELTNHEQRLASTSGAEEESEHVEEEQTLVGNDVERLVESSIQYGGDLINEGAVDNGGGFDGAEGSYPFGNLATMGRHGKQNTKRKHGAHFNVNHGVNNLRKDELSVDVNGRDGAAAFVNNESSMQVNSTLKNTEQNVSDATMNITFALAERMTNGTLASVMENPKRKSLNVNDEYYWSIVSLIASVIIATLPVITIFAFFCTLR